MDKFKSFFTSKVTKAIAWVVLAIVCVILILGGATVETISSGVALTAGIVAAVSALIAFIASCIKS